MEPQSEAGTHLLMSEIQSWEELCLGGYSCAQYSVGDRCMSVRQ